MGGRPTRDERGKIRSRATSGWVIGLRKWMFVRGWGSGGKGEGHRNTKGKKKKKREDITATAVGLFKNQRQRETNAWRCRLSLFFLVWGA